MRRGRGRGGGIKKKKKFKKSLMLLKKRPFPVTSGARARGLREDLCGGLGRGAAAETGVKARRTRRPPALSAAGPHDGSQSGQAQLLGGFAKRLEVPNAAREGPVPAWHLEAVRLLLARSCRCSALRGTGPETLFK